MTARYSLEVRKEQPEKAEASRMSKKRLIAALRKDYAEAEYAIDDKGECQEVCKWSMSEEDLRTFSEKWQGWLFMLKEEGEGPYDMWMNYFLNGKCQRVRASVSYAPFDPDKLA